MQILSLEKEDKSSILERHGLLYTEKENKNKPLQELEEEFKQSTSDLPIGKAIHLLLHIHDQVLDKAIQSIKASTPKEHILLMAESPTIKSILSLDHYLGLGDAQAHFRHLYDPFKEKILKKNANETVLRLLCYFLLYSTHKTHVQQFFMQVLEATDKRSALAVTITLKFLLEHYEAEPHFPSLFIPSLIKLSHVQTPTLLACSAFEVAVSLCKYALHQHHEQQNTVNSAKIIEIDSNSTSSSNSELFRVHIDTLIHQLETWQKNKTPLELESYKELHRYINDSHLDDPKEFNSTWDILLSFLTPKKILSTKPLPLKKQEEVIQSFPGLSANLKMVILALLQKGQWVENYGKDIVVTSTEDIRLKSSLATMCRNMNYTLPGGHLIPVLVTQLPYLCTWDHIQDAEVVQATLDRITSSYESFVPMVLNQPETSVCHLLLHIIQQNNQATSSFEFMSFLISNTPDQIIPILVTNLLPVLKISNQACELLIQCMAHTELIPLIQKLLKLVLTVQDKEKERMVYIALISKVLLEPHWMSDSIMIYTDLIRNLKKKKKLVAIKDNKAQRLTPFSITSYKHNHELELLSLNEEEINAVYPVLLGPIQLWSSKVNIQSFEIALVQLVHYSYGKPRESICIDVWKNLSFAFVKNRQLCWPVIETCLNIMKTQPRITDDLLKDDSLQSFKMKESMLFLRLSPMLILQTIPKETYDIVQLPNSYLNLKQKQLNLLGINLQNMRVCHKQDAHTNISIELMDELLQRSFETKNLGDNLQNPVEFATSLLLKIFYQ